MQTSSHDTLLKTLDERPNSGVSRTLALVLILACAGAGKLLGGTWIAVFVSLCLATAAFVMLPASNDTIRIRLTLASYLGSLYSFSVWIQIALALGAFVLIEMLDYRVGGLLLGRIFNLYLCAIFVHTLCFGFRNSLLVWPVACLVVYFFELPPEFSFKLRSLSDYLHLVLFIFLGLASASAAFLIRVSSVLYDRMDERH